MKYNEKLTLIFEGVDGSGKSTLIKELQKRHKSLELIDRGFTSDRVYAKKFNRDYLEGIPSETFLSYWEHWHANNRDVRIIFCDPPVQILIDRCIEKKDDIISNCNTMEEITELLEKDRSTFKSTLSWEKYMYGFKVLSIDTNRPIEESIKDIEDFINDSKV